MKSTRLVLKTLNSAWIQIDGKVRINRQAASRSCVVQGRGILSKAAESAERGFGQQHFEKPSAMKGRNGLCVTRFSTRAVVLIVLAGACWGIGPRVHGDPSEKSATPAEGVSPRDDYGLTPLLRAVWKKDANKYNLVRQLIVAGADVNETFLAPFGDCEPGATALHMAASKGDMRMAGLLLSYGCPVDGADVHGETAAYLAAKKATYQDTMQAKEPFYGVLKTLLMNGANSDVRSKKEGKTLSEFVLASRDVHLIDLCRTGGVDYPGPAASIADLEEFIRRHPRDKRVAEAVDRILALAAAENPWIEEAGRWLARLQDVGAAAYDPATGQLLVMGPNRPDTEPTLPPLLWDDFYQALDAHKARQELGVSIGTYGRSKPTAEQLREQQRRNEVPVEYIPDATADTHLGHVFFEIDRKLKILSHGEDNLTGEDVQCTVPGYFPVTFLHRKVPDLVDGKPTPFARHWFEPPTTLVRSEGYSMEIVNYRMHVRTEAYTDAPAPRNFGAHLDKHFEEYAAQIMLFRELVRMHKLVQVARWFHDCDFPDQQFDNYRPLVIKTPRTTKRMVSAANTVNLLGGIRFAAANRYVEITAQVQPSAEPATAPAHTLRVIQPIRFGSTGAAKAPLAQFVQPIVAARPAAQAGGWSATVKGREYAVAALTLSQTHKP